MSAPLPISVVIPAHNRAALVERALRGVAAQRPRPAAEVIVVDDGSSDPTAERARALGARVVVHGRNLGQAAARNSGLRAARQPWVAWLDSDDEWLPHHLATLWPERGAHALVAASVLRCGPDPARDRYEGPLRRRLTVLRSPAPLLAFGCLLTVSAVMTRRDALLALGGFRTLDGPVEDLDAWCRLLDGATGGVLPDVTVLYHLHDEQISGDRTRLYAAHAAVAASLSDRAWWSPAVARRWEGVTAWDELREQLARGARKAPAGARFARALAGHPQRIVGVGGMLARRFAWRRRSAAVGRDGQRSLALLPGAPEPPRPWPSKVVDLRGHGVTRALAHLARRPAGAAAPGSAGRACALRLLGVHPLPHRPGRRYGAA